MKLKKVISLIVLIVVVSGSLTWLWLARNQQSHAANGKITVSASFYPLYEFARQVGGDKIIATSVIPAGAEPHDYEPTPQVLVATQKANTFIYNGGTMEPWVDKFLPDYKNLAIKASDHINLQQTSEGKDPHFWLDPMLAQQIVANIRDGLIKISPANKDYFTKNAAAYVAQLAQLDKDFKTGLQTCQTRTIITSHDAFSYFGQRYNLDVVSIAGMDPDSEPSAAKLAELSNLVRQKNVKYVFFESLVSPRLADTIAQETSAKTAVFDPLEGLTDDAQKAGKNYITVQHDNLKALQLALGCQQ